MIRFIDLRGQGTGYRFAFWDTVTDQFFQFSGSQAWDTADDFCRDFTGRSSAYADTPTDDSVERFLDLIAGWAFRPAEGYEGLTCLLEKPECVERWLALQE
jgi:hypothetical protein